jgi:hypothetical protein
MFTSLKLGGDFVKRREHKALQIFLKERASRKDARTKARIILAERGEEVNDSGDPAESGRDGMEGD